jgi:hypothetical protein
MTETPGEHLDEEPQQERGGPGTRDKGFDEPGSGHRPAGTSDADDSTSIDPQEPDEDAPTLQTP